MFLRSKLLSFKSMSSFLPIKAEVTNPQLGPEVDLAHRVENSLASLPGTHDRVVLDRW